jgi:hypothetical protein
VFVGKLEPQLATRHLCLVNFVLSNAAGLVFDFYFQFLGWNHLGGKVENLGKPFCGKAMIGIISSDPGLEEAGFEATDRASAVDEALHHMPNLCDVEIRRDRVTVRQDETDIQVGVLA